jgi:hypothetical protein
MGKTPVVFSVRAKYGSLGATQLIIATANPVPELTGIKLEFVPKLATGEVVTLSKLDETVEMRAYPVPAEASLGSLSWGDVPGTSGGNVVGMHLYFEALDGVMADPTATRMRVSVDKSGTTVGRAIFTVEVANSKKTTWSNTDSGSLNGWISVRL